MHDDALRVATLANFGTCKLQLATLTKCVCDKILLRNCFLLRRRSSSSGGGDTQVPPKPPLLALSCGDPIRELERRK